MRVFEAARRSHYDTGHLPCSQYLKDRFSLSKTAFVNQVYSILGVHQNVTWVPISVLKQKTFFEEVIFEDPSQKNEVFKPMIFSSRI